MSKRTLLMIGGGIESVPGIRTAKSMGLHVVISDGSAGAPGLRVADAGLKVSTYDIPGTVAAARRYHRRVRPIDGVISVAVDVPETVASVAQALKLPGIPVPAARLSMDKLRMKERFRKCGVAVPWFHGLRTPGQLKELWRSEGAPLILKPVDSRGSRGVIQLDGRVDLEWAFAESMRHSPSRRLILERFLSGPQLSTESIVLDGGCHTVGWADRNYEHLGRFHPFVIENGGVSPTALSRPVRRSVDRLLTRAAAALGIRRGVIKGDIVIHRGRPYVIELAARLSGGCFCTHLIPMSTGVDFVRQAIRLSLGEDVRAADLAPRVNRWVSNRCTFPRSGKVTRIDGLKAALGLPGVKDAMVYVRRGSVVPPPISSHGRAAMFIATGRTREEAQRRAERAAARLQVETVPCEV